MCRQRDRQPMSISTNGSAFAYWADDPGQENGWFALKP
jgi:hypothetical protein